MHCVLGGGTVLYTSAFILAKYDNQQIKYSLFLTNAVPGF